MLSIGDKRVSLKVDLEMQKMESAEEMLTKTIHGRQALQDTSVSSYAWIN